MKTNQLYFGAAYYDEYLPYDRIEQDLKMMSDAGMNTIRIAESTWSTLEPQEGVYDFTHIDRMLDAALRYGMNVIIGTPTYAIPSWLAKKAPDILTLTHSGPSLYGHRQNMDLTSPVYLKYAENIIRVLLKHVCNHPCVIGYQIDNETHHYDTCGPRVQQMFVDYLKNQYPDIQTFNQEFGLDYWSNRIDNWDDFPDVRGTINGSLAAEFEAFQRSIVTRFHHWQANIINEYRKPEQFITHNFDYEWHNFSFGLQPDTDQFSSAACMDVAGGDIYHPSQCRLTGAEITFCGNILRGLKHDNYLILETQAQGNTEWLPYPGQLRLCAYSHIANGSNSVMYWHWHSIHNAIESYWKGVLSHDFSAGAVYKEASVIGKEFQRIGTRIKNIHKYNTIALLLDHRSLTGLSQFPTGNLGKSSYNTAARWLGDSLHRLNLEYDILYTNDPELKNYLKQYRMVITPALYSTSKNLLHALNEYTAAGGTLVASFRSAFTDEHLKIYHDAQPHMLTDCFGLHYDTFTNPKDDYIELTLPAGTDSDTIFCGHPSSENLADSPFQTATTKVREWMELLTPDTATVLARYSRNAWADYAAVTMNQYQKGQAFYLGCLFDDDTLDSLMRYIASTAGLKIPDIQFPVVIKTGENDTGERLYYYLNYSDTEQTVTYSFGDGIELLTETSIKHGDKLNLSPWDVAIICI